MGDSSGKPEKSSVGSPDSSAGYWNGSFSDMDPALFREYFKQFGDKPSNCGIDDGKVRGESEDSDDDDRGCGPDLLPRLARSPGASPA